MKKTIGIITTLVLVILATLQGTEFGVEIAGFFENVWVYLGVALGGYGSIAIVAINSYIKHKLGKDIIGEFNTLITSNPQEAENILTSFLGTAKAKELLVQKDEYVAEQKELLRQKILENRDKLLNLDIKINTKGLLSDEQLRTAIALQADIKEWLNENDTKSI